MLGKILKFLYYVKLLDTIETEKEMVKKFFFAFLRRKSKKLCHISLKKFSAMIQSTVMWRFQAPRRLNFAH